ncbi:hypothetical protein [Lactococcus lactis]|uniref:hypothetical protein n=1 Tax=Lactococcus lactis TaxID=1358 RepID=UPI0025A01505|nr:hypothetical protein [Lactococcus lactis]MDM7475002.1 hypothetical protein [Lactococcus lactis]
MNPRISELFDRLTEIDETLKFLDPKKGEDFCRWIYFLESRDIVCMSIRRISKNINPQIPEPWVSMSADEIIKGLGVYR